MQVHHELKSDTVIIMLVKKILNKVVSGPTKTRTDADKNESLNS